MWGPLTWVYVLGSFKFMEKEIRELRKTLRKADRVSVLTGAGISAEIDSEKPPHTHLMDFSLLGKAGDIVPKVVEGWA